MTEDDRPLSEQFLPSGPVPEMTKPEKSETAQERAHRKADEFSAKMDRFEEKCLRVINVLKDEKYAPFFNFLAARVVGITSCAIFGLFIALTSNPIWMVAWMIASVSIWKGMSREFPNPL